MKNLSDIQAATIASEGETIVPAKTARMLLKLVRAAQPISRVKLAQRLGINRSTVTDIFKPLINAGILREEPFKNASDTNRLQGRPPIGISFNSDDEFFIGVNLGVRRSQVGLTTLSGEILAETEFETPPDANAALKLIQKTINEFCAKIKDRRLKVIGVSVPGPTDSTRSRLLYAPHLGWRDIEIADALRKSCGSDKEVTVIVENDAAAALYEARLHLKNTSGGLLKIFILLRSEPALVSVWSSKAKFIAARESVRASRANSDTRRLSRAENPVCAEIAAVGKNTHQHRRLRRFTRATAPISAAKSLRALSK